jgi:hypothetical protein
VRNLFTHTERGAKYASSLSHRKRRTVRQSLLPGQQRPINQPRNRNPSSATVLTASLKPLPFGEVGLSDVTAIGGLSAEGGEELNDSDTGCCWIEAAGW